MGTDGGETGEATSSTNPLNSLFKINRDTPEARANQLAWAREQMDMEVPESALDGTSIKDRQDFIQKYIESEKAKFGREVSAEEAEREVDAWLLKQATYAPSKTSAADLTVAALVFAAAFGAGLFFSR